MTLHRRPRASVFGAMRLIVILLFFIHALLEEQFTVNAYSVWPTTRGRRCMTGWRSQRKFKTKQVQTESFLPQSIFRDTSLQASSSFDYVRNSTASATSPQSRPFDKSDDDDTELLQFMEEALLELESFQKTSYRNSCAIKSVNKCDDRSIEKDTRYSSPSEMKLNIKNHESSPWFHRIDEGISTDTAVMIQNDSTVLSESDTTLAYTNNGIAPKDNALSVIDSDPLVNNEGVWRARWLLVAAAALYGTNFSVVKLLGDQIPVSISTSLRFGLAALATLPWLFQGLFPKANPETKNSVNSELQVEYTNSHPESAPRVMAILYGLEVGLWNSIGYVAQAVGLETTLASKSAFLCSMAVVIVPILDWVAGKRLLHRQWVGALMATVGVAFLELGDFDALLSSGDDCLLTTGDILSLIQPFAFGLGFWRMEQAMQRFPREAPRMTAAQLMAIFISSVGYGLWTLGAFEHFVDGSSIPLALSGFQSSLEAISASFPWKEWITDPSILFSLFWTGCITTALTIYMETLALESLSAAETTLIFSTEPLWGTAFAVAVMGEQLGMNLMMGAGLILTACVYSNLGVRGTQEIWASSVNSFFAKEKADLKEKKAGNKGSFLDLLQDHWPWLSSGFAGSLAAWNIASDASQKTQELDEIVEGLIENLVDKL